MWLKAPVIHRDNVVSVYISAHLTLFFSPLNHIKDTRARFQQHNVDQYIAISRIIFRFFDQIFFLFMFLV